MTTIDDVIAQQKTSNVLYAPEISSSGIQTETLELAATSSTLSIGLQNQTTSSTVYAYITGLAINNNNAVFLLESDGATAYYPSNPSSNGTALSANCAIALGAPGTTRTVTIPYIAGGRIWFCVGNTLTFLLNPGSAGPGLVEPSVTNTSDPNYYLTWDFCEFTYNSAELYANISYVDFVCLPIALTSTSTTGTVQHVGGMPSNGLTTVCNNLIAQNDTDGAGWNQLIVTNNGSNLRALSPSNGIVFNSSLFENYWTSYITSVWAKYVSTPLVIDTQASWGTVSGYTSNDRTKLVFGDIGSFTQPAACDIFGANSGAFAAQATNTAELLNIGARLDAAFNRSTLLIDADQPDDEQVSTYYTASCTNHYARIVHAANVDGLGYTFPYDDVTPTGGADQSGKVEDGSPASFLVTVGGANAYSGKKRREVYTPTGRDKLFRRSIPWEEDVKEPIVVDEERDLEQGLSQHPKLLNEIAIASPTRDGSLPPVLDRVFGKYLTVSPPSGTSHTRFSQHTNAEQQFRNTPFYVSRLRPLIDLINQFLISFLSLSMRAILSRVFILVFFLLFYFFDLMPRGAEVETQKRILESLVLASGNATVVMQGS